jgi:hypothetical protein
VQVKAFIAQGPVECLNNALSVGLPGREKSILRL